MTYRIKDWNNYQHFKDRRPPWIKLYRTLLDDPEWFEMTGDDARCLVMLWLIASENDGALPEPRKLAFRLRITEDEVVSLLDRLSSHWLIQDDITPISRRHRADIKLASG